jgi:DNA-binding MarR family transcriptional regulator
MTTEAPLDEYSLSPALDFLRGLWRMNHAIEQLSSRMQASLGITAQQRLIIRCVGQFPGITAGRLAALLHVDPGTLSTAVRRLEARHFVRRRRDPSDSRRVTLGLTPTGRSLDLPMAGTLEGCVAALLDELGGRDAATVASVIARLTVIVEDADPAHAPARAGARATPRRARASPRSR